MDIAGRVALVTGGATGIGRATCEELARAGVAAVVVDYAHSEAEALATVETLRAMGTQAIARRANVANAAEIDTLVQETVALYGRLDMLVNSAATTTYVDFARLEDVTDEVWAATLGVNVVGVFNACRAAAPYLTVAGGSIVNLSSISAHRGVGSSVPYAASKAAVLAMTRALAIALAPHVRVNSVSPGSVESRWLRPKFADDAALRAAVEASARKTPIGRNGRPADIAQMIVSLLASDFVTGQDVIIDGGRSLLF